MTEYYKNNYEDVVQTAMTRFRSLNIKKSSSSADNDYYYDNEEDNGYKNNINSNNNNNSNMKPAYSYAPPRKGEINYGLVTDLVLALALGLLDPHIRTNMNRECNTATSSGGSGSDSSNSMNHTQNSNISNNSSQSQNVSMDVSSMMRQAEGCILVFMPGVGEISKTIAMIQSRWQAEVTAVSLVAGASRPPRLRLLPLHSALSSAEQKAVFVAAGAGELKVVVSTNVAEVCMYIHVNVFV